jgi:pyruvate formate lyase activating enzyme
MREALRANRWTGWLVPHATELGRHSLHTDLWRCFLIIRLSHRKKPLYHFYPGTIALTSGSVSCNFDCPWCQNWDISNRHPKDIEPVSLSNSSDQDGFRRRSARNDHSSEVTLAQRTGAERSGRRAVRYISPEEFVRKAVELGCQGTSISLNEPVLSLEWSLHVFRLAREQGLDNTYVSYGYMTPEALRLLVRSGLGAMNVDLKGDAEAVRKYCGGIDVERVWRICRLARELGVHLEITTLVIPGVNDSDEVLGSIAERIVSELGAGGPWHVGGYFPAYHFKAPPTPVRTLEWAWEIGHPDGLLGAPASA